PRCRTSAGDIAGAIEAYDRIPVTANAHLRGQLAKAETLLDDDSARTPAHVDAAADVVDGLPDGEPRARLEVRLFAFALDVVREHGDDPSRREILGPHATEPELGFGF